MPRSHRQRSCTHQSDESRKHQHAPYPLRVGVSCFEYQDGWGHIDLLKRRKRRTRTRSKNKKNKIVNSTGSIKLDGSRAEYCRKWILLEFSYCWISVIFCRPSLSQWNRSVRVSVGGSRNSRLDSDVIRQTIRRRKRSRIVASRKHLIC